jgi:hypothetical protein
MGKGNFEKGGKGDFDVLLGIAVFSPDNTAFLASSLILAQKKTIRSVMQKCVEITNAEAIYCLQSSNRKQPMKGASCRHFSARSWSPNRWSAKNN